jgi:Cu2+-exporting ATPase
MNPNQVKDVKNEINYSESVIFDTKSGIYKSSLIVEGIQCGSCVWLIENTLKSEKKIIFSRVNISTQRLSLHWKGKKDDIYQLVNIVSKLGYTLLPDSEDEVEDRSQQQEAFLLKSIAVSGFATIQLMMIVMGIWYANIYGSMGPYTKELLHLFAMLIAIPSVLYSGLPFYRSAYKAIRHFRSNMDIPISIGVIATVAISISEYIRGGEYTYFDSAVMLIFALLIGRYLDLKARNNAMEKARELILRQSRSVTLFENGQLKLVSINKTKIGDIIYVGVGEKIPVDGRVIEGNSEVDNSIISGETLPLAVNSGDEVYSGTINVMAPIKIEVKKLGDSTLLGEIIKLIENAEQGRAKFVRIADRISALYTPAVLTFSVFTFIIWVLLGETVNNSILNAVAVLIITCPCALGLAVPVVQILASSRLLNQGIYLKSADALERFGKIEIIIFDKTGTLTKGKPHLINLNDISFENKKLIASLAAYSKHPLCSVINSEYIGELIDLSVIEEKGMGLEAQLNGEIIRLGNREWCSIDLAEEADIYTEMWFKRGDQLPVRLKFSDILRDEAKDVINALKSFGYELWILSGDRDVVVRSVAIELGVANYLAECRPQEKYKFIEELENQNKHVLMIGDGLNDSPAMRKAYASASPSNALDITQNFADIVFRKDLASVIESLKVAKKSDILVKQNFIISILYNILSIPIAAIGIITPLTAALAMSLSSICVIMNSLRLNNNDKFKIKKTKINNI